METKTDEKELEKAILETIDRKRMKADIKSGIAILIPGLALCLFSLFVPSEIFNLIVTVGLGLVFVGGMIICVASVVLYKSELSSN